MIDVSHLEIVEAVRRALEEDIGSGDVTSEACVPAARAASGEFIARETQIVAGVELLPLIYELRGGVTKLELRKSSGQKAVAGDVIATVTGSARTLLACERVALNFLQRLGGVATLAARYVERTKGTNCQVLDTRKTTPGLRRLEKMAAAAGGVTNHRMGLYDAILIKNNHITAAGGVRSAIEAAKESSPLPVEIEVRTRAELREALESGAQHLLLDNFTPADAAKLVRLVRGRAKVELSGGINLKNVRQYAKSGADFVSSGAITHSAPAVDISFRLDLRKKAARKLR
ncbi:MAG TPA: carboxylating nicotinate-nucleotide diphosphorylase [Bryobacteraceae bacterium]|jgi:nicotinate-nucleotide pyrophosphorylase (carboxylating)|nr:carboxylating nicotinate-nucleotide diphosphorylase [Bryobacteraceae bacterium]